MNRKFYGNLNNVLFTIIGMIYVNENNTVLLKNKLSCILINQKRPASHFITTESDHVNIFESILADSLLPPAVYKMALIKKA